MTDTMQRLHQSTTGANKKTKVKVTASPLAAAPWVSFAMDADYVDKGGKQDGEKLKFDPGAGPFELVFDLHDNSNLGLAFFGTIEESMWVAVGTSEPTGPGLANGTISGVSVTDRKLTVINANSAPETLTFQLRFTGTMAKPGYPPFVYDPIIDNGGGRIDDGDV